MKHAITLTHSMDQFPAGTEHQATTDSYALSATPAKPDDFLAKITNLNTAAGALLMAAATDLNRLKGAKESPGTACSTYHKAIRQPEE